VDPENRSFADRCTYPAAESRAGVTGTVIVLVYVASDGSVPNALVDTSSGSSALDDEAVNCLKQNGRFLPKRIGSTAVGSWGRMKFRWSFGD
jgi:TonB family protein